MTTQTTQFAWPTPVSAPSTQRIRQIGLEARADAQGHHNSIAETFAQLRSDLTNENFISALGRFAVDDPARLDRLALANLQESKRARNSLSALHSARTCLFGARQLGDRKWYADKPGIAARLKTQDQRRQFRLGLVANLAFFNKLNINDLQALLQTGDPSGLASLTSTSALTIPALRDIATLASPIDILRIISPQKATTLTSTIKQIISLADYVQSVCGHLAANEALEPAHSVICQVLRTGADFERANATSPIHLAAAAIAPLCHTPDVDGKLTKPRSQRSNDARRGRHCYGFQRGRCNRSPCPYRHVCSICNSPSHGDRSCTTNTTGQT